MASVAPKFSVYQNPTFSGAVKAKSLHPSDSTFARVSAVCLASAVIFIAVIFREDGVTSNLKMFPLPVTAAKFLTRVVQMVVGLALFSSFSALIRVCYMRKRISPEGLPDFDTLEITQLTPRQKQLLGIKPKQFDAIPTKPRGPVSRSDVLVPLHSYTASPSGQTELSWSSPRVGGEEPVASYAVSSPPSESKLPLLSAHLYPHQFGKFVTSTWPRQRRSRAQDIHNEAMLEDFLNETELELLQSVSRNTSADESQATPLSIRSFGLVSPNSATTTTVTLSGTPRITPLRPARISPASQRFSHSPKKGEDGMPLPMRVEEIIQVYEDMGIYQNIDKWRDSLRQWFSSVLLKPLVEKIETSHIQVMLAAARLGISVTVSKVGSSELNPSLSPCFSLIEMEREWEPTCTLDEDGVLHRLHATLVQARDASPSKKLFAGAPTVQQDPAMPLIEGCLNAIVEHMRLYSLLKGDWIKGLLPYGNMRTDLVVKRIQELAEGTCVKKYDYMGGEHIDKQLRESLFERPSDSHLLLYLFCAFLEHPKWVLHADTAPYSSMRSSKNPLCLGFLPLKDRIPDKYVAVISGAPSVLHPGALVLAVNKQSSPVLALYWDKMLQLSLQGRTAFWDAILIFCHHIQASFGGVVRGLHLGPSPINISSVFDSRAED